MAATAVLQLTFAALRWSINIV